MQYENLIVLKKNFFTKTFTETRCNVPGDWNKTYCPTDYQPHTSTLVGIFSNQHNVSHYLHDLKIDENVDYGEDDPWGACTCYVTLSGYYHTATDHQLETITIKGKKYAKYGASFVEIDSSILAATPPEESCFGEQI